ncbi:MAG TPA: hypothetical protein VGQ46_17170 [Thermoanaerobaculia bacterium]|nr:hypothetical protein [Thermoanaerobaculia bacterium]
MDHLPANDDRGGPARKRARTRYRGLEVRFDDPAAELRTVGYRGFRVQSTDPGIPSTVIVRGAAEIREVVGTRRRHAVIAVRHRHC